MMLVISFQTEQRCAESTFKFHSKVIWTWRDVDDYVNMKLIVVMMKLCGIMKH